MFVEWMGPRSGAEGSPSGISRSLGTGGALVGCTRAAAAGNGRLVVFLGEGGLGDFLGEGDLGLLPFWGDLSRLFLLGLTTRSLWSSCCSAAVAMLRRLCCNAKAPALRGLVLTSPSSTSAGPAFLDRRAGLFDADRPFGAFLGLSARPLRFGLSPSSSPLSCARSLLSFGVRARCFSGTSLLPGDSLLTEEPLLTGL